MTLQNIITVNDKKNQRCFQACGASRLKIFGRHCSELITISVAVGQITPQLGVLKQPFSYASRFCNSGFVIMGTAGKACLCFLMSEASAGKTHQLGLASYEGIFPHLSLPWAGRTGRIVRPVRDMFVRPPIWGRGFLPAWWSQGI